MRIGSRWVSEVKSARTISCIALISSFAFLGLYFEFDFSYSNVTLKSKILLDRPICELQNLGIIARKRAFFSPLDGKTIDTYRCRESLPPRLIGHAFPSDLIVVSDLGGRVERISRSGRSLWHVPLTNPRGVNVIGGLVYVADGRRIFKINGIDGSIISANYFSDHVTKMRFKDGLLWVLFGSKESSLSVYKITGENLIEIRKYESIGSYARDFDVNDKYIYVADTFGHRVRQLSRDTSDSISEMTSFYPNSIQVTDENIALVAEEHLNAITYFDFGSRTRAIAYSCKSVHGASNLIKMRELANQPLIGELISPCQSKSDTSQDIFSPNDAFKFMDAYYIADCDNHRVVYFSSKTGFSSIVGFNNPVSIFPISD